MKTGSLIARFALLVVAGCAMPPVERMLLEERPEARTRIEGSRGPLSPERSAAILARLKAGSPDTGLFDRHLAIEEAITSSPLVAGNKAILLRDGPATYEAMFEAIAAAREHVNLETYIFEDDETGRRFAGALLEARARGVQVNLMYDSVGSLHTPREFFGRLADGGVDVVEFNPVNPLKLAKGWDLNERDHRKLLVVDGRIAFLGGINISGVYSSGSLASPGGSSPGGSTRETQRPWRDTHLRLEGPVVAEIQKTFIEAWRRQRNEPPSLGKALAPSRPQGREVVRTLATWGDHPESAVHVTLISAMASAEKSVHITMAYFAPDPQFVEALKSAAARGVDVKVVLPGFTDSWGAFHAGRSHYDELLAAGVKIHERRDRLLHAKTAVIDGVWSTVGSANLDWRSFAHNHELNAVVLGADFGARMQAMFEDDLAASEPVTLERWRARPLRERMGELAARLWAYWL